MFVLVSSLFFLFGSVRQTKLATRQLLGHRLVSYRNVCIAVFRVAVDVVVARDGEGSMDNIF